jgi:hypothetical protein
MCARIAWPGTMCMCCRSFGVASVTTVLHVAIREQIEIARASLEIDCAWKHTSVTI